MEESVAGETKVKARGTLCHLLVWKVTVRRSTCWYPENRTIMVTSKLLAVACHLHSCLLLSAQCISSFARIIKLDSLHWFSQRHSPTPHFWGAYPGVYDPKIWTRPRFLYNAPTRPKFHHSMFTRSEVIMLSNKHTPLKTSSTHHYATILGIQFVSQSVSLSHETSWTFYRSQSSTDLHQTCHQGRWRCGYLLFLL